MHSNADITMTIYDVQLQLRIQGAKQYECIQFR